MLSRIFRYGIAGALAIALFSVPALTQGNSQGLLTLYSRFEQRLQR